MLRLAGSLALIGLPALACEGQVASYAVARHHLLPEAPIGVVQDKIAAIAGSDLAPEARRPAALQQAYEWITGDLDGLGLASEGLVVQYLVASSDLVRCLKARLGAGDTFNKNATNRIDASLKGFAAENFEMQLNMGPEL